MFTKIGATGGIHVIEGPGKYEFSFDECGFKELGCWSCDIT